MKRMPTTLRLIACASLWGGNGLADLPPAERAEAYRIARAAYEAGSLQEAGERFAPLLGGPDEAGVLARFGLANVRVRQATSPSIARAQANAFLLEAVALYRAVLDGPSVPRLDRKDASHNLELAKRLLKWPLEGDAERAGETRSGVPTGALGRPTEETVGDEQEKRPGQASQRPTAKDQGAVQRPAPGLPWVDAAPLAPEQAQDLLERTLERIDRERQARLVPSQVRPSRPGDY